MNEQEQAWPPPGAPRGDTADGTRSADSPAAAEEPESQGPAEEAGAAEDEGPRPLGVAVVPTGHEPVDARLRRLEDADHLAVSGHLDVYEDVHRGLRDTLADLDRHEK